MTNVFSRATSYIAKRDLRSDDEVYLHFILLVGITFASFLHAFLFFFFTFAGNTLLSVTNAVSLVIYFSLAIAVIFYKKYTLVGLAFSLEVLIHSWLIIWQVGSNNGILFYFLLLIVMQLIIPYINIRVRVLFIALFWFSIMMLPFFDRNYFPVVSIGFPAQVLLYFNIGVGTLGIIVELTIGNIIRNLIAHTNNQRMESFENQAHTDQLTGLFNRRYADLVFSDFRSSDETDLSPMCIAMLDIDDFKKINDTFGHNIGDEVLIFLSDFLTTSLRKSDIVFRWGGEEFLILLENANSEIGAKILDKIRNHLSHARIPTKAGNLYITVTIGVADLDIRNITDSIALSDSRLYHGKQTGKNKVVSN